MTGNPEFGEHIVFEFSQYFSKNVEDYRLRGNRSAALKNTRFKSDDDEKGVDPINFFHSSLNFLISHLQLANKFTRLHPAEETKNLLDDEEELKETAEEEEPLLQMTSLSFLIQDCD